MAQYVTHGVTTRPLIWLPKVVVHQVHSLVTLDPSYLEPPPPQIIYPASDACFGGIFFPMLGGALIIESVDSINRDERGFPLTQYITNWGISRVG